MHSTHLQGDLVPLRFEKAARSLKVKWGLTHLAKSLLGHVSCFQHRSYRKHQAFNIERCSCIRKAKDPNHPVRKRQMQHIRKCAGNVIVLCANNIASNNTHSQITVHVFVIIHSYFSLYLSFSFPYNISLSMCRLKLNVCIHLLVCNRFPYRVCYLLRFLILLRGFVSSLPEFSSILPSNVHSMFLRVHLVSPDLYVIVNMRASDGNFNTLFYMENGWVCARVTVPNVNVLSLPIHNRSQNIKEDKKKTGITKTVYNILVQFKITLHTIGIVQYLVRHRDVNVAAFPFRSRKATF